MRDLHSFSNAQEPDVLSHQKMPLGDETGLQLVAQIITAVYRNTCQYTSLERH